MNLIKNVRVLDVFIACQEQYLADHFRRARIIVCEWQKESPSMLAVDGDEIKLFIRRGRNQVKVEVNHVSRGTVLPVETWQLGKEARRLFTRELSVPVLATSELYGSKLVAAMDRQHPRDLFDVCRLFERGGLPTLQPSASSDSRTPAPWQIS